MIVCDKQNNKLWGGGGDKKIWVHKIFSNHHVFSTRFLFAKNNTLFL